ncbi:MAG: MFS transporter [Deltaproteobacteria bacterium]|nr:MFS transporter [Deltaproteobacteria bacterium]
MPTREGKSSSYCWVIVGVLWLAHVLSFVNFSGFGILAPFIKEELQLSSFQIGFLISALSIGSGVCQMPAGLLVDFAGVRRMMTLGMVGIGLFLVLFSLAPSFPVALVVLLFYGAANSVIGPGSSKCVMEWFPAVGRATAMGIKQTGVNFGGILAGLLLPAVAVLYSWRQGLFAIGLVEVAAAIPIYWLLRVSPVRSEAPAASLDWGRVMKTALRRDMLILGGIGFCFMASQFCFSTYLTLFLIQEMKYPIARAGQYYALSFFIGAAARVLWSAASDYLLAGRRKGVLVLITGLLFLSSLGLGVISFFPVLSPLLVCAVLAFGMSGIGWNAIYLTIMGESAGKESAGLAIGIGYGYGFLGGLIAPPIFGFLVDRTDTYGWSWLILTLCTVGIMLLLTCFREKPAAAP